MHPSVIRFAQRHLFLPFVSGADVLEVGSRNINGSVRPYVETMNPARYLGVDMVDGAGVDVVADCEELIDAVGGGWDIVICTETLEHVKAWQACIQQLVDALLPGGYLLLTTRSPGFPVHDFPGDYWRFTRADIRTILTGAGLHVLTCEDDATDTPGVLAFARKPDRPNVLHDTEWLQLDIATPQGT